MSRADILKKLARNYVREEATAIIQDLEDRLELAVSHLHGDKCPACGEESVVNGCSGGCCVLCDWEKK